MNDPTLDPVVVDFIHQHDLEHTDSAFVFSDGEDLHKPGLGRRRRTRIRILDDENRCWELYLKRYGKPPLLTRLGRLLTGRRAHCQARQEFLAIRDLREGGVPTMRQVCWDAEYGLLGAGRNHVIVTAVPGDALERVGEDFLQDHIKTPAVLEEFTDELIYVVRRLHDSGYVHRDLYASHLFLHDHEGRIKLYLIDLARAFKPRRRRFRWRVKDLAQLKFSMPWIWVTLYWDRFLAGYLRTDDPAELQRWSRAIDRKVGRMERRQWRKLERKRRKARP